MNAINEFPGKYIHQAYRLLPGQPQAPQQPTATSMQLARVVRCWLLSSTLLSMDLEEDQTISVKFKAVTEPHRIGDGIDQD
ncbi:MAG: hypothetical protein K2W95_21860 [Candidatus Obscuribacterales bacterium]|nr:hypothetical protein [Candidatus Obscuribacterales bacterium]